MKKVFTILLIGVLLFGVTFFQDTSNNNSSISGRFARVVLANPAESEKLSLTPEEEQFFINQAKSNDAYQRLMEYFAEEAGTGLLEAFPDYYSGAKINSDGSLTIRVYNASEQEKQLVLNICEEATVVFEETDYALSHLICVKDSIREVLNQLKEDEELTSYGLAVYDVTGQIKIEINSDQADNIQSCIEQYISVLWPEDAERIIYKTTDENIAFLMNSGDLICSNATGTLGFKAKYNMADGTTKYGFVTAGHVLAWQSYTYDSNSIWPWNRHKIGTNICYNFSGGTADAGFVESESGYPVSSTINGYSIVPDSYGLPASNTLCYKVGCMTGTTSGYIQTTLYEGDFIMPNGLQHFTFQIEASISGQEGDSGSALYYPYSSSSAKIIGVLMGGTTTSGTSYLTYYSYGGNFPWSVWPAN